MGFLMHKPAATERFNHAKLFQDVFAPDETDVVHFLTDHPHGDMESTPAWQDRRKMAEEWRSAMLCLSQGRFRVELPYSFPATGANNGDLPDDQTLKDILEEASLIIAMTQFSATAPLMGAAIKRGGVGNLRIASMPRVERRMEKTALAADYKEVARRCHTLLDCMQGAEEIVFQFSTGHTCSFDTRFRTPHADDGCLHRNRAKRFPGAGPLINLPAGETFIVPYEGERDGITSNTCGKIPVWNNGSIAILTVEQNKIIAVSGENPAASYFDRLFGEDPARAHIAEVAFGCNSWAEVTGNVLEDEKAGPHFAYGRSEHLGGIWDPSKFKSPKYVLHQDEVYARDCPVQVKRAWIGDTQVINRAKYLFW